MTDSVGAAPSLPVLVVEDDWQMAQTISWVLEEAGFQVEVARDGQAGWEQAQRARPSLVVLDWRLPWLSSLQFAENLRQRYGDAVPVLLITADVQVQEKAKQLGATDWLSKPFEIDQFIAAVRRLTGTPEPNAT
jgi:DNA-binding response OmpR family regulator